MAKISAALFGVVRPLCYSFVSITEQQMLRSRRRCKVSKVGTIGVMRFEMGSVINQ